MCDLSFAYSYQERRYHNEMDEQPNEQVIDAEYEVLDGEEKKHIEQIKRIELTNS